MRVRNYISVPAAALLIAGASGCAGHDLGGALGRVVIETGKAIAEPLARVGVELGEGNFFAPLYAPRGAINGLERFGHALTGYEYPHEIGQDGSVSEAIPGNLLECATLGVVAAPLIPLTFFEAAAIGGVGCLGVDYLTDKDRSLLKN